MATPLAWQTLQNVFAILERNLLNTISLTAFYSQTLIDLIEHYIPKFRKLNKKEKLNIIIMGLNIDNDEFLHLNTILTVAVQNFILKTKRFETM